jgi:hypothetical protein
MSVCGLSATAPKNMIIWLASYPRSGNTFFRILLNSLYGIKTYSLYNDSNFEKLGASETVGHLPLPASVEDLAGRKEVYFVKTHGFPIDENPAIYLVRDGRDALVSYARYIQSFEKKSLVKSVLGLESFQANLKDLIKGNDKLAREIGTWNENVLRWVRQRPKGKTVVIRYEDLVKDPESELSNALKSLGLSQEKVDGGTKPSFEELHAKWPEFFRKGKSGSWREEMSEELHKLFWDRQGEAMAAVGYVE